MALDHMYLLALIILTLGTASLACRLLIRREPCCSVATSALIAVSIGWLVGTLLVFAFCICFPSRLDLSQPLAACALSILSLLFVFFYTWQSLDASSTDDLIGLVAVVNASALAPISLPYLFLLLACCAPSALPSAIADDMHEGPDPEQGQAND